MLTNTLPADHPTIKLLLSRQLAQSSTPEIVRLRYAQIPEIHRWASFAAIDPVQCAREHKIGNGFVDHLVVVFSGRHLDLGYQRSVNRRTAFDDFAICGQ